MNTAKLIKLETVIKQLVGIEGTQVLNQGLMRDSQDILLALGHWEEAIHKAAEEDKEQIQTEIDELRLLLVQRRMLTSQVFTMAMEEASEEINTKIGPQQRTEEDEQSAKDAKEVLGGTTREDLEQKVSDKIQGKETTTDLTDQEIRKAPLQTDLYKECTNLLREGKREEAFQHASTYLSHANYTPREGKKTHNWKVKQINSWLETMVERLAEEDNKGIEDAEIIEDDQTPDISKEDTLIVMEHFPECKEEPLEDGTGIRIIEDGDAVIAFATAKEGKQEAKALDDLANKLRKLTKKKTAFGSGKLHAEVLTRVFFCYRDYTKEQITAWLKAIDAIEEDTMIISPSVIFDHNKFFSFWFDLENESETKDETPEEASNVKSITQGGLLKLINSNAELNSDGNPKGSLPNIMAIDEVKALIGNSLKNEEGKELGKIDNSKQLEIYISGLFNDQLNTNRKKAGTKEVATTYPLDKFLAITVAAAKAGTPQERFIKNNRDKLIAPDRTFLSLINSKGDVKIEINSNEDIETYVASIYEVQKKVEKQDVKDETPKSVADDELVETFDQVKPKGEELVSKGWSPQKLLDWGVKMILNRKLGQKVKEGGFLFETREVAEKVIKGMFPDIFKTTKNDRDTKVTKEITRIIKEDTEGKLTFSNIVMGLKQFCTDNDLEFILNEFHALVRKVAEEIKPEIWTNHELKVKDRKEKREKEESVKDKAETTEEPEVAFKIREKELWEKCQFSITSIEQLYDKCIELMNEGKSEIAQELADALIDTGKIKGAEEWGETETTDWFEGEILRLNTEDEDETQEPETTEEIIPGENDKIEINLETVKTVKNHKKMQNAIFDILLDHDDIPEVRNQIIATIKSLSGNSYNKKLSKKSDDELHELINNVKLKMVKAKKTKTEMKQ